MHGEAAELPECAQLFHQPPPGGVLRWILIHGERPPPGRDVLERPRTPSVVFQLDGLERHRSQLRNDPPRSPPVTMLVETFVLHYEPGRVPVAPNPQRRVGQAHHQRCSRHDMEQSPLHAIPLHACCRHDRLHRPSSESKPGSFRTDAQQHPHASAGSSPQVLLVSVLRDQCAGSGPYLHRSPGVETYIEHWPHGRLATRRCGDAVASESERQVVRAPLHVLVAPCQRSLFSIRQRPIQLLAGLKKRVNPVKIRANDGAGSFVAQLG